MTVVLGFDTATAVASVGVIRDGELIAERVVEPGQDGRPRHTTHLLEAIGECTELAGGWREIARIAVGVGPGSFTGLRIGIATARALAQANGAELAAIGSLQALWHGIERDPAAAGHSPLPMIDARRGQAFGLRSEGPDGEAVLLDPAELAGMVAALPDPALAAGDGAVRFRSDLEAAGALVPPPEDTVHRISALDICALGARSDPVQPSDVEPHYIREPDADAWRRRKRNQAP